MESPGFRADSRTDFRKEVRSYARIHAGRSAAGAQTAEIVQAKTAQKKIVQAEHVQTKTIQKIFGDSAPPSLTICAGSGAPCAPSSTAALAREISGDAAVIISPQPVALGLAGTGALFHLILALSNLALSNRALSSPALASPVLTSKPSSGQALLLSTARDNGFAALQLSSP
jgi:hypothetical protein